MEFITKNLKWITIIFIFLFLFKTCESCNRNSKIKSQAKQLTALCDSTTNAKDSVINLLFKDNQVKAYLIKDLYTELKIAGIKIDEAEKRNDAIKETVKNIRTNTTIEIKK